MSINDNSDIDVINDSVLLSIKKLLGIELEEKYYDVDIITYINTSLASYRQIGIDIESVNFIKDDTQTWRDLVSDSYVKELIKTLTYLKVRLVLDPPTNSFLVEAIKNQIKELEWRIQVGF